MSVDEDCFRCHRKVEKGAGVPVEEAGEGEHGRYRCRGLVCPFELAGGYRVVTEETGRFRVLRGSRPEVTVADGAFLSADSDGRIALRRPSTVPEILAFMIEEHLRTLPPAHRR